MHSAHMGLAVRAQSCDVWLGKELIYALLDELITWWNYCDCPADWAMGGVFVKLAFVRTFLGICTFAVFPLSMALVLFTEE